jgi:site-specific recombinase XerD
MSKERESKPRGVFEKKPGSGIWWIQYFDAEGHRHRERVGRKSSAITLYQKRRTEVVEGKKLPILRNVVVITFDEIAKDALEYSRSHKISFEDDEDRMNYVLEEFGGRPVDSIRPNEIERWLSRMTRQVGKERVPLKPATLNRYRALLSLVFRIAVQNGKAHSNPARLVRPRRENNAVIRYLLPEEERRLRAVALDDCPHHLPELDLALNTGMRQGEQYNLTWEHIDFERRLITIPRSKHGDPRYIELNDTAIAALRTAQSQANDSPHVFLNCYGQKLSKPREWFEAAVKKAGIQRFTWHCLRHTFASRLVMAGVDLRTVQELMGHKTIQMTCRYAHLAPKHRLAAVQRLCDTEMAQETGATTTATGPF